MPTAPYLRYPHLNSELLTFVAGDDVWLASLDGGRAWKLSDDLSPVTNPRLSPDGAHVAWTSTRHGMPEVLVASVDGGEARRLTYWGNPDTKVVGWRSDAEILVISSVGEDHVPRDTWLRTLSLDGTSERLPYGPVSDIAIDPDSGAIVLASAWRREPAHWKRYRGGTATQLWIDRDGSGAFERLLPDIVASLIWPMWIGGRLVFTSDHDGVGNLYSVRSDGGDVRQHTHHDTDEGYVRTPSTDGGGRIVYHALGDVFVMDSPDAEPRRIDITLGTVSAGRTNRPIDAADEMAWSWPVAGGSGSAVQVRGASYFLTHRGGPARALSATPGVRVRDTRPLGATQAIAAITDADGEDAIEVCPLDGSTPQRIAGGQLGRVLSMTTAPNGELVAVASHDGRILVVHVASGTAHQVGESPDGEATGLAFSPDSAWLVWSQPKAEHHAGLRLVHLDDAGSPQSDAVAATSGQFRDFDPAFTRDGKHLAFLSTRVFDPVYDVHTFEISFPAAIRPYLIPLAADTPAPFGPDASGWSIDDAAAGPDASDDSSEKRGAAKAPATRVDPDGLEARAIAFPVAAGSYRRLAAIDDGVVWLHDPPAGTLGHDRATPDDPPPRPALEHYALGSRKFSVLAEAADDYRPSPDGKWLAVRDQKELYVAPADRKVEPDDDARVSVDLSRIRHVLDPVAEWRQMYEENARLMRDHFWRADMGGVDWDATVARYRPLVDRVASRDDLVDVLWEVVAELGTSHAYVMPQDSPIPEERVGFLGADFEVDGDGRWSIARILPGETSDPAARSPLRAPGVGAQVGDRIVAIDGLAVDGVFGPPAGLRGAAGKPVELTLEAATDGVARRVAVVPLADEESIRYHAWVSGRREAVRQRSNGRLGYVHVPDMMPPGWAQLHRDITDAVRADGVVVDVRYNRGGHLSQLVIERLSRRIRAYSIARHGGNELYPFDAPRGPVVFVANQWTGSDGDIITAMAKLMDVGPVIGVRTWGGVVGIDGRFSLVDGTVVTQPRYAFWIDGFGWGVENHGADPDIEVPMAPQDWAAGADPQLDRAVDEALQRLEREPASVPPEIPALS